MIDTILENGCGAPELGGGAGGGPTVTRTVIIPGAQQGTTTYIRTKCIHFNLLFVFVLL